MLIPMLDEVFEIAARAGAREALIGMAHRGRLNVQAHAVGRPYREILAEFEGEKDVDVKTAKPRGGTGDVKYHQGLQGAFNTPSGHTLKVTLAQQPEPPRVRRPGRRGPHARRPDRPPRLGGEARPERRAADPDPRRRRLPGRGSRRRDAEPPGARGLHDRRHDPHHRQQPDRLHDRARGVALDALRLRPRKGLRRPDRARQRRRPGGLHRRRAAGDGLPRGVQARRRDRPDRLPPPRPQRGRRARLHAAADVRADPQPPTGAQDLRRRAGQAGPRDRGGGRAAAQRRARAALGGARGSEADVAGRDPHRRDARSTARAASSPTRPCRSSACSTTTASSSRRPTDFNVHRKLKPQREKRLAGRPRRPDRLGATPRRSRSPRCSRTACRCG